MRAIQATVEPQAPQLGGVGLQKILDYLMWMKREGYKEGTIESHSSIIRLLARKCNLLDPESVREFIADSTVAEAERRTS